MESGGYNIYIDVLLFENLVMNYLIISVTARFVKRKIKPLLIFPGAAIGAAYAAVVVLVPQINQSIWLALFGKIALSALMVVVTFPPKTFYEFFRVLICFYIATFIFAGVAFAFILLGGPGRALSNGLIVLCDDSPASYLAPVAGGGYILVKIFYFYIKERTASDKCFVRLYVEFEGNGMWIPALVDTGNELKDPFTGDPVIIAEFKALQKILPEPIKEFLTKNSGNNLFEIDETLAVCGWADRFRLVPYNSLGCENGLLAGFIPDAVAVSEKDKAKKNSGVKVVICLYPRCLSESHAYSALLSPEVMC